MKMIEDLGMLYASPSRKRHYAIFECPRCGKGFKCRTDSIVDSNTKSCGCLKPYIQKILYTVHGSSKTKLYNVWVSMRGRCYNKNNIQYRRYGGRGISVCDEWKVCFDSFKTWSISNGYKEGLVLDRINNDGDYAPHNCRWTTRLINTQNKGRLPNNKSGYKGVYFSRNKWAAKICNNYKLITIGSYLTPKEAAKAYNDWVIEHGTAHQLNVIED